MVNIIVFVVILYLAYNWLTGTKKNEVESVKSSTNTVLVAVYGSLTRRGWQSLEKKGAKFICKDELPGYVLITAKETATIAAASVGYYTWAQVEVFEISQQEWDKTVRLEDSDEFSYRFYPIYGIKTGKGYIVNVFHSPTAAAVGTVIKDGYWRP